MKPTYFTLLFLGVLFLLPASVSAQKVLLIEKYGRAKTTKIRIGDEIRYRLKGEKEFRVGYIEDLRTDTSLIVLGRGYLSPDNIDAFQYDRRAPVWIGRSLMVFGLGWSFFAGVADLTNLGYDYTARDAIISGTSLALGFSITLFKKKTIRFGKKRNLRIVDLTPFPNRP
jgi:hypothetical protein